MAVPEQLIGRGNADHAATHDHNVHGGLLDRWRGELISGAAWRVVRWRAFAGTERRRSDWGNAVRHALWACVRDNAKTMQHYHTFKS